MTTSIKSEATKPGVYKVVACVLVLNWSLGTAVESAAGGKVAIEGYDPVAYFEMLEAVKGSESISHEWLGDQWYFVNEKHKALFVADPVSYAPSYGGYCSYDPYEAGHDHNIDPTAWRIVDGELYLFFSEKKANRAIPTAKWEKVKAGLNQ